MQELKLAPASKPCLEPALAVPVVEAELAARSARPVPAGCVWFTLPRPAGVASNRAAGR